MTRWRQVGDNKFGVRQFEIPGITHGEAIIHFAPKQFGDAYRPATWTLHMSCGRSVTAPGEDGDSIETGVRKLRDACWEAYCTMRDK